MCVCTHTGVKIHSSVAQTVGGTLPLIRRVFVCFTSIIENYVFLC